MKKILIIKPSSLGDIIHALPVAAAISKQVPGVIIDWIVRPEYTDLLKEHPSICKLFIFDRRKWAELSNVLDTMPEILNLIRAVRKEKYDMVLDLQGLFRSGLLAYLSGSRLRLGFENAREFASVFYNRKVMVPTMQMHAIERYQLFLEEMGLTFSGLDYNLKVSDNAVEGLERLLLKEKFRTNHPLIILNPNARWETKRWLPGRFAKLADQLVDELNAEVVIIGGESDVEEVRSIEKQAKRSLHNFAGRTTIMQLAALLEKADLMITCDSGPMHLAAAVGTKILALFGPTDPVRTGPYGPEHRVLKKAMDCAPCLKRSCTKGDRPCMEAITVDEVLQESGRLFSIIRSGAATRIVL